MIQSLFTVLICVVFVVSTFHDWLDIPGWTHGRQLRATLGLKKMLIGTVGNGLFPGLAAGCAIYYWHRPAPPHVLDYWFFFCGVAVVSAIAQWWIPYFFGATAKTKQFYARLYEGTRQVLPARGDNPRPNVMHLYFHALGLTTLILAGILWARGR